MDDLVDVAALTDLVDGKGLGVTAHGCEIAIFKIGDRVFAIEGVCPHQRGVLANGRITPDQKHVVCPRHAWCFNLETGAKRENPRRRIATHEVVIREDRVLVGPPCRDPIE